MKTIPYTIERSKKRRKSVAILVTPLQEIIVRAPQRTSDRYIKDLIEKSRGWIQKKLANLAVEQPQAKRVWKTGEIFSYLGNSYTLEVWSIPSKKASCELMAETLFLKCLFPTEAVNIKKTLERWYRKEAEILLKERTLHFTEIMGVVPREIIIKQQKNRWGSCDSHNIIRYNWKVIMAPADLIDYLVVHELAHIREKNHGKAFWEYVASILPDYQERRRRLKSFHTHFD